MIMIDPIWDESTSLDPAYTDVIVDIYSPVQTQVMPIADAFELFVQAMKVAANVQIIKSTECLNYLADKPEYEQCMRISSIDALDCWYGFIYTVNSSAYRLKEDFTVNLKGLEIAYPDGYQSGQEILIDLEPGEDHIIILRRTEGKCSYATSFRTHARELSDEELIQKAKDVEQVSQFGEEEGYFKLYCTAENAVFYFENPDSSKTLEAEFDLQLDNLYIVGGEEKGQKTFKVSLGPGETGHKILKSVDKGKGTSIQMSYSYSAQ